MSPSCENDCYHPEKKLIDIKITSDTLYKVQSSESEVINRTTNEQSLSFINSQMSLNDRYRYSDDSQQSDRYNVKNESSNHPNNSKNYSSQEYTNCTLGSSVEMKEWGCSEFVVDESMKVGRETRNGDVKVANENAACKIEAPRDKALFNLLNPDEQCIQHESAAHTTDLRDQHHDKNECNDRSAGAKEYSQGLLRYELTSDFDIDEWHCKDSIVENSARELVPRDMTQNDSNVVGNIGQCDRTNSLESTTDRTKIVPNFVGPPSEWFNVLFEGLNSEAEEQLGKKYPLTGLFDRFEARRPEAKSSTSKVAQERDDFCARAQNNTGSGICAIFTALAAIKSGDTARNFDLITENLIDAGKIFAHLHYLHSERKKSLINSELADSRINNIAVASPARGTFRNSSNSSRALNAAAKTHHIIPNCQARSLASREISTNFESPGNNFNSKEVPGVNCTNETVSQRVKRSLCGITDEEYNAKKKREESGQDNFPGIVEILKQARALHGVHEELLLSWPCNAGAVKRYQKPIKLWWEYCQRESIDVYDVSISTLKSFFVDITKEPKTYETLNAYKTAVLLLTPEKLEKDRSFTEFLKEISIDCRKT